MPPTDILTSFGPLGGLLVIVGAAIRYIWPDLRSLLERQTEAVEQLTKLAERSDVRMTRIEETVSDNREDIVTLLARIGAEPRRKKAAGGTTERGS